MKNEIIDAAAKGLIVGAVSGALFGGVVSYTISNNLGTWLGKNIAYYKGKSNSEEDQSNCRSFFRTIFMPSAITMCATAGALKGLKIYVIADCLAGALLNFLPSPEKNLVKKS